MLIVLLVALSPGMAEDPSPFNVVWNSPSADHHGTMPLGNGDISLNAWIEPSGDLVFYIGKTDSWGDNGRLLKVGRVRITLDPTPPVDPFHQELSLNDGTMNVRYGDGTRLRVWVDANHPVIRVDVSDQDSSSQRKATAAIELWRTERFTLPSVESSDVNQGHPQQVPTVVEPDTILTGQSDRIGWFHHNSKSVGPTEHSAIQGVADFRREDPLLHRTFGALITAPDARRVDDSHLESRQGFSIYVLTQHPATPEEWLASIDELVGQSDYDSHRQWWADFWDRSWIHATTNRKEMRVPTNDHRLRIGSDQAGQNKFRGELRNTLIPEQLGDRFTLKTEVYPASGETGRIFDKITPGGSDGFLLDAHPGNALRLIAGSEQQIAQDALPAGEWATIELTATPETWQVTVNGQVVISITPTNDAAHVSQMFALQRFITASAGRGQYPIKFNGSLFTVPAEGQPGDADYRRWGPGYWWQNTRLPYISACANGDFDLLEPLWRMYVDQHLPLNQYRTKKYFGFDDSAYYIECVQFWGDAFLNVYGRTPYDQRDDPLQTSGWHKWEWVAGPELVWMMLDHYDHAPDESLLKQRLVPTANAVIRFFDNYYPTDAQNQLVMHPSQACETWWDCTNPMPELAGLRAITSRLLALPDSLTSAEDRAYWKRFLAKLPPLPTRDTPSGKALAPAEQYANKRNIENPELYAVFPFRLCSFEKSNRDLGRHALEHRWDRGHFGWRQDDIFMAYLGLTKDARHGLVSRARNSNPGSRFPAFWGPNYDWIPDQDHGGVLMKTFQAMLMQTEGQKIYLLPAWPADWDVDFKLHAPHRTTVQGRARNGQVLDLKVTPPSRADDVIVCPIH